MASEASGRVSRAQHRHAARKFGQESHGSARGGTWSCKLLGLVALVFAFGCSSGTEVVPNADSGPPGSCAVNADCASMGAASLCCGGSCVDPQSDVAHCGSCAPCATVGHGVPACVAGACSVASCDAGWADCDKVTSNGCEENTDTAAQHCGACGNKCSVPSGTAACDKGACVVATCATGRGDCNGKADDGCEVDLRSDLGNCGECSKACTAPSSGTEMSCVAGACRINACKEDFGDCDGDGKGCEVDLRIDPNNCGACGKVCPKPPNAAAACVAGVCSVGACDVGYKDCDAALWNGCEVKIDNDPLNCGACGKKCDAVAAGTLSCVSGACGAAVCSLGYADCDITASTGCEVSLADDAKNCGLCGNVCPTIAHGTAGCSSFVCGRKSCDVGWDDCYGGTADGCETSLLVDVDNCGSCGKVCPSVANGTRDCGAGACKVKTCNTGFDDCDKDLSNGCESRLATDPKNCSTCGNACTALPHATPGCKGGACALGTCDTGWANCNSDEVDGCEKDVTTDPNNCGGCGLKCGSGSCVAGACVCSKSILVLRDDSTTGATTLAAALTSAGYTVTTSAVPSYQYNGTNPATTGFGAVVVLAGGPNATSYSTDMPIAGQTALKAFVDAGNGLVFSEWAAYQVSAGRWTTLAPYVLLTRSTTFVGIVNAAIAPELATHPLWEGMPATFSFSGAVNVGVAKSGPNISVLGSSPEAIDLVVIRDAPVGRVVHFAGSGNYVPSGWTNVNVQKLMVNAAGWAARCK